MTGQQLIDKLNYLVDDTTLDSARALELINAAYQNICSRRVWNFLVTSDTSNTISSSTTAYALPSDFLLPVAVRTYDTAQDSYNEMAFVPFSTRRKYHNSSGYVTIDKVNDTLVLTSSPSDDLIGDTIELDYTYLPSDITVAAVGAPGVDPVLPEAFQSILAYEAAKNFFYAEQSDRVSEGGFDVKMAGEYNRLYSALIDYDMQLGDALMDNYQPQTDWSGLSDS